MYYYWCKNICGEKKFFHFALKAICVQRETSRKTEQPSFNVELFVHHFGLKNPCLSPTASFLVFLNRASTNDYICPITGGGGGLTRTHYFDGRRRTRLTELFAPVATRRGSLFSFDAFLSFSLFPCQVNQSTAYRIPRTPIKVCFVCLRRRRAG